MTAPWNRHSIAFHTALGFKMKPSDKVVDGFPVYPDYHGRGEDVIIFTRALPS